MTHTDGCPRSLHRGRSPKMGWRSGFPTGRPWDFAIRPQPARRSCIDRSHVHAASRTLLLGSRALGGPFLAHSRVRWVRCDADRRTLSSRGDTSLTATLTRPACRALSSPLVPGGLNATLSGLVQRLLSGRWPPASALPALVCFAGHSLQRSRTPLREPFSNFAVHFRVRRRRGIYARRVERPKKSTMW